MKKSVTFLTLGLMMMGLAGCGKEADKTSQHPTSDKTSEQASVESQTQTSPESSFVAPVEDDKVHIVVLSGQSGGRGKALVSDLTKEQNAANEEVDILEDGMRMENLGNIPEHPTFKSISPVKPGLGDSASEFGPELGIGETMATRYQKNGKSRKSMIVKYTACGSTFTDHWFSKSMIDDPNMEDALNQVQIREDKNGDYTGPLTNNLYQLVDKAIAQVKEEGYEAVIDGLIWVHGEQDAKYEKNMEIYEKALGDFIHDFREYVGDTHLSVVVTEAVTNSGRYCNKLREIQKKVSSEDANTHFVNTEDLYSNTFEPWHFGAQDNFVLGHRAAAELIALNDNRKITKIEANPVNVSVKAHSKLPEYLEAEFENGTTGTVKVSYDGDYQLTEGNQAVCFKATTNWGVYDGKLPVHVSEFPMVDGKIDDWADAKTNDIDGKGTISFKIDEANGDLYFAANITDGDIWTDAEAWHAGDMGQKGGNDDLRLYLTNGGSKEAVPVLLSSANLMRIYAADTPESSYSPNGNMIDNKAITNVSHYVRTTGEVNVVGGAEDDKGMVMEGRVNLDDLGLDASGLKVVVAYNDITSDGSKKTNANYYLGGSSTAINNDASYVAVAGLI